MTVRRVASSWREKGVSGERVGWGVSRNAGRRHGVLIGRPAERRVWEFVAVRADCKEL